MYMYIIHIKYIELYMCMYIISYILYYIFYILFPRQAWSAGRKPEGEGANLDRHLVPYHGKCKRIQSGITFIYLFIYLYICINRGSHARGVGILALVKSVTETDLIAKTNLKRFLELFFPKRNIIFLGTKERNFENKASLYYYG